MAFEYYNNPKTVTAITAKLYAYCANSSGAEGFVDEHLSLEWKSVLHVCLECRAACALPLARTKRRNGASNEHRSRRAGVAASSAPQASNEEVRAPVVVGGAVVFVESVVDVPSISPAVARRGRNRRHLDEPVATRSRKTRSRRK